MNSLIFCCRSGLQDWMCGTVTETDIAFKAGTFTRPLGLYLKVEIAPLSASIHSLTFVAKASVACFLCRSLTCNPCISSSAARDSC